MSPDFTMTVRPAPISPDSPEGRAMILAMAGRMLIQNLANFEAVLIDMPADLREAMRVQCQRTADAIAAIAEYERAKQQI